MDGGVCGACGSPDRSPGVDLGLPQQGQQQQRCQACGALYSDGALPPEVGRAAIADLMRSLKAYDVMAESSKVVVFDVAVPARLAFYALVEHDASCAPLWDSTKCCFVGAMTLSDVVDIMRIFYTPASTGASVAAALAELTIESWRAFAVRLAASGSVALSSPDVLRLAAGGAAGDVAMSDGTGGGGAPPRRRRRGIVAIDPEDDLFSVTLKLRRHRMHHMPVLDCEQNAVAAVLSHRAMLSHVLSRFSDARPLFAASLYALGLGTFDDDVVVVPEAASVISVLNVLAERRIAAVPVVNAAGVVCAVWGVEDVGFLANDPSLMVLDAPVGEVRRAQVAMMGPSAPVVMCSRFDSLHRALELFAATGGRACERLVCVDEQQRCTGVVTLSDVFRFFTSEGPIALRSVPVNSAAEGGSTATAAAAM